MLTPDRRGVYDAAGMLVQHMRKHSLDGVERTVEVHIENVPPIILGHVLKQALLCYACVVN